MSKMTGNKEFTVYCEDGDFHKIDADRFKLNIGGLTLYSDDGDGKVHFGITEFEGFSMIYRNPLYQAKPAELGVEHTPSVDELKDMLFGGAS